MKITIYSSISLLKVTPYSPGYICVSLSIITHIAKTREFVYVQKEKASRVMKA